MKNVRSLSLAAITAAVAVLLSACGSTVKLDENQADANKPAPISNAGEGSTSGVGNGGASSTSVAPVVVDGSQTNAAANADLGKSVYFDFDSFIVKDEYKPVIEGNAKYLMASHKKAAVEGNTDERGSKEYNLALGQKRAEAVVKSLTLVGVNPDQLEAVSFGEEKPMATGQGEEAWAKNRRVDIRVK
ncbi:MAG TPA: peptidoglycan-associated lipoprotein Pal [Aquabacterium sp.]|nr:peptidoglycan-associated lipoprotein Pal [Aquabacterium sp.]